MAFSLRTNYPNGWKRVIITQSPFGCRATKALRIGLLKPGLNWLHDASHEARFREKRRALERERNWVMKCSSPPMASAGEMELGGDEECGCGEAELGSLVSEYRWNVRRLVEEMEEMREAARVQAEAFHVPVFFLDDLFFKFFQAEVLSGLVYKLRKSPPDRYACLVAESMNDGTAPSKIERKIVGVVDVTASTDRDVVRHLQGAKEYLYVSGLAVLKNHRRQKVATVLLKACDMLCVLWGFEYLALRAYEDDSSACTLYTNAGYRIVSGDPPMTSTWIGKKRRLLMIKRSNLSNQLTNAHV